MSDNYFKRQKIEKLLTFTTLCRVSLLSISPKALAFMKCRPSDRDHKQSRRTVPYPKLPKNRLTVMYTKNSKM